MYMFFQNLSKMNKVNPIFFYRTLFLQFLPVIFRVIFHALAILMISYLCVFRRPCIVHKNLKIHQTHQTQEIKKLEKRSAANSKPQKLQTHLPSCKRVSIQRGGNNLVIKGTVTNKTEYKI